MNKNIQLISFDLDNTLWDVKKTIIGAEKTLRLWMQQHTPEALAVYASDAVEGIRHDVLAQHPNKRHDLSFLRIQVLQECMLKADMSMQSAEEMAQEAFDVFFAGRNRVVFFDNAIEILESLSKNYRLFALTNGNANIDRVGIGHLFSGAISSADVGASKPDPKMFSTLLERSGATASCSVHIGDHLSDDILGASKAGMHSIWFNYQGEYKNDSGVKPTREVRSLAQLPSAIADL